MQNANKNRVSIWFKKCISFYWFLIRVKIRYSKLLSRTLSGADRALWKMIIYHISVARRQAKSVRSISQSAPFHLDVSKFHLVFTRVVDQDDLIMTENTLDWVTRMRIRLIGFDARSCSPSFIESHSKSSAYQINIQRHSYLFSYSNSLPKT